jgi:hypothetical protein
MIIDAEDIILQALKSTQKRPYGVQDARTAAIERLKTFGK